MTKKFFKFQIKVEYFFNRVAGSSYFPVFQTPILDWCKLNDPNQKKNLKSYEKVLMKSVRKTASALFHPCPFEGRHTIFNATCEKDILENFPIGNYKLFVTFSNQKDGQLLFLNLSVNIFK